eukprot:Seg1971.4 transcript_id=Seg1971.4/GoldUCD/mRNA.D3Y31 product=Sacsin protein_id=Seg1971.4/GoldUCD/D3Y31
MLQNIAEQGFCQLTVLNESKIADLLRDILPQSLCSNTDFISLSQILQRNIPISWFQNIWEFINKQKILSKLEGLPLIPLGEVSMSITDLKIAKVTSISVLVYAPKSNDENLVNLLSCLGFEIVTKLPKYVLQNGEIFGTYVHHCTPEEILPLFWNMTQKIGLQSLTERLNACNDKCTKIRLRNVLADILNRKNAIEENFSRILRKLSIFENTTSADLVSVEACSMVAPQEMPKVVPIKMLLKCADQRIRSFAGHLGVRILDKADLISEILIDELEQGEFADQSLDEVMEYILPKVIKIDASKKNVIKRLQNIEFMLTEDGTRRKPCQLFDGQDQILLQLFKCEKGKFPAGIYAEEEYHRALVGLGLKKEIEVSVADITGSLQAIPDIEDAQAAYVKALSIMNHLKKHQRLLQDSRLRDCLITNDWVPIVKDRPKNYPASLTWFPEVNPQKSFSNPQSMHNECHVNLVGSVRFVYDNIVADFMKLLDVQSIQIADVVEQLRVTIKDYNQDQKNEFVLVLKELYSMLNYHNVEAVKGEIRHIGLNDWVWNGYGFSMPNLMIVDSIVDSMDLKPYAFVVPQEMKPYEEMLLHCGTLPEYTDTLLLHILDIIKQANDLARETSSSSVSVSRDLQICKQVITSLSERDLPDEDRDNIPVPVITDEDEPLRLVSACQTVYSPNGGYITDEMESEMEEEVHYLHSCIPEEIAKSLSIRSVSSKLMGAEDLGVFEEYGQSEPLTRRINRLLDDYGDGLAIVKELIQNADDAGATEIKFLYDERQNLDKQKSLIDPAMKEFQGPAFWAYNNATFTKEDFENIVKLSGATKGDKRDKIGRFGLGFNAVYNITDVPSFISDNQLVIFDPHLTNLGNAIKNKSKPGIKIPLGPKRTRLKQFEDQIKIYDGVFGIDASLKNNYKAFKGTLFRFPLRTKDQAIHSDIKRLAYTKEEMVALLKKYGTECDKLLMFTQNVKSVEFFHLERSSPDPKEMQLLMSVSKSTFTPNLSSMDLRSEAGPSINIMHKSASAIEKGQAFQPEHERTVVDIQSIATEKAWDQLSLDAFQRNETWFIHSVIGSADACMEMALKNPKLNPVSSIAAQIVKQSDVNQIHAVGTSTKGYFYCFLPLPILNGLPFHINGTFAVTSDRKSFKGTSEDEKCGRNVEASWNHALLSGPVTDAYLAALEDLTRVTDVRREGEWYKLWPTITVSTSLSIGIYQETLIKTFYQRLMKEGTKIFPDLRGVKWLAWSQIKVITPDVTDSDIREIMGDIMFCFNHKYTIVKIPESVTKSITEAGCADELNDITIHFPEFFTEIFMPNIKQVKMRVEQRNRILLHAIKDYNDDEAIITALKCNDCIPTEPNGKMKRPTDLVNPSSKVADLFTDEDEVFPTEIFRSHFSTTVLKELGMVCDSVSWELLLSRAGTIANLESLILANERVKTLVSLVTDKVKTEQGEISATKITNKLKQTAIQKSRQSTWSHVNFLPVRKRPYSWGNLPWAGDDASCIFVAPADIFSCRSENLIGCHSFVIDEETTGNVCEDVCQALGVRTEIRMEDVATQVDLISSHINDHDRKGTRINKIFRMIYKYLEIKLGSNDENKNEIHATLCDTNIILTDDCKLVRPQYVAMHHDYSSQPYLYKLPETWQRSFSRVMHALGVKTSFTLDDYIDALKALKDKVNGTTLTENQLKLVRDLLESIKKKSKEDQQRISENRVYLPDEKGMLYPKEVVLVKEKLWMKSDPTKKYLHTAIPRLLALELGAKTARSESIASQSRGIAFGQHEKLTVRLKRILQSYPAEMQILYELLQNADDAGASEVKFILDERSHSEEQIFGDAWKPLQGPALVVFNDAPFTEADLAGIQNLGEGSKSDDAQKTGQYGIGFNVVYHVTDVPCLLTSIDTGDNVLCVFDPHTKFLDECSQAEPGRMFQNARGYLEENFPDIYKTFLPEILKNDQSAIFRLPLRNVEMASNSLIKQTIMTVETVKEMFEKFAEVGPEAILFLRHVKSVRLMVINERGTKSEIFSVQAKVLLHDKKASDALNTECRSLTRFIEDREHAPLSYDTQGYEVELKDGKNPLAKWKIIQKCASIHQEALPIMLESQYADKKLPIFPMGGIACRLEKHGLSSEAGKVYCLLPLAVCSSLPVHVNGKFILDHESRRRLWYSKDTFQTVWNHYIIERCIVPCYVELIRQLASEVRIYVRGDKKCDEVLQMTYPNATQYQSSPSLPFSTGKMPHPKIVSHPVELHRYFGHFPKISGNEKTHEYDEDLIKMFYKQMSEQNVEVMPVLKHGLINNSTLEVDFCPPNAPVKQFYVPNFKFDGTHFCQDDISNICDAMIKAGMNLYNAPNHLIRGFRECGSPLTELNPGIVAKFLRGKVTEDLHLPQPLENTILKDTETVSSLLKYCMIREEINLEGLPLLVTEEGMLRIFDSRRVVYYEDLSNLFPSREHLTLHSKLRASLLRFQGNIDGPVQKLSLVSLSHFLNEDLDPQFRESQEIEIFDESEMQHIFPKKKWLRQLWTFLRKRYEEWERETRNQLEETERKKRELEAEIAKRSNIGRRGFGPIRIDEAILHPSMFLAEISAWCFLPIERQVKCIKAPIKQYLIPINMAKSAVDAGPRLSIIVTEIGLPTLACATLDDMNLTIMMRRNSEFVLKIIGNDVDPNSFLQALEIERMRQNSGFCNLQNESAMKLLEYFRDHVYKLRGGSKATIKSLPVWIDLTGVRQSLQNRNVYLVPSTVPNAGVEILREQCDAILLKEQDNLNGLYEWMGLAAKSISVVYCELILPNLNRFTDDDGRSHLKHLMRNWKGDENYEPEVMNVLKKTRFIERNESLALASEFFDPKVEVLSLMLPRAKFPPEPFCNEEWLPFMRMLGLVSAISEELFLTFANQLSASRDEQHLPTKSKALISYLQSSEPLIENKCFLSDLAEVCFLVADPLPAHLEQICPTKTERRLIRFRDSIKRSEENLNLVWTTETILPSYACKLEDNAHFPFGDLHVKENLSHHSVAKNLQNISESDSLTSTAIGVKEFPAILSFKGIVSAAYKFFQTELRTIDSGTLDLSWQFPSILVPKRILCIPKKVTLEQNFNWSPYLFSAPVEYGQFFKLFERIGVSKKPTLEQFVHVLSQMHTACKHAPLDPNEANFAVDAVLGISKLLETSNYPDSLQDIFLPGCTGQHDQTVRLYNSRELMYVDDTHLMVRLKNLNKPLLVIGRSDEMIPRNGKVMDAKQISDMITKLPERIRPTKLSDVLTEKMLDSETLPNCEFAMELENKINCVEFVTSVIRLIKHQVVKHSEDAKRKVEEMKLLLQHIKIETKEDVKTALFHSKDGMVEGSETTKDVFVKEQSETLAIYVSKEQADGKRNRQYCAISSELIHFFGDLFSEASLVPHLICLLGADPSEMHDYLTERGIFDDDEQENYNQRRYTPGAFVPIALHCLLKSDITDFEVGEYVAYEVEDPGIDNEDGDPVYIYAVIREKITQSNDGSSEFYKINIGGGETKIAHKSELYRFHRQFDIDNTDGVEERSLDAIKEDVRKQLGHAYKGDEITFKRVIKRLWLQWHPDKNPGNEEMCHEIFIYIQEEVSRLRGNSGDGSSEGSSWNWYSGASRRYQRRGKRHTADRQSHHAGEYTFSDSFWMPSSRTKNPQPGEARRWYRQAKHDFDAARNDESSHHFEWVCFKCHQAAEKGLKAAAFMVDSGRAQHHFLSSIAATTGRSDLQSLANELSFLRGSAELRYPDRWCYPVVPHDKYNENDAEKARQITENLLQIVDRLVHH